MLVSQSTHPRGVRQNLATQAVDIITISIHAPTWGATLTKSCAIGVTGISIHAPTWGATYRRTAPSSWPCYFNPRTHVGCDCFSSPFRSWRSNFNPRTHVGCDTPLRIITTSTVQFQSTHPRGVRPLSSARSRTTLNFNPRTHVGCDAELPA